MHATNKQGVALEQFSVWDVGSQFVAVVHDQCDMNQDAYGECFMVYNSLHVYQCVNVANRQ